MSSLIIYKDKDNGSVSVCSPAIGKNETIQDFIQNYLKNETEHYKLVSSKDIPSNQFFFDDWVYNETYPENPIDINVEKAHERWKNIWRELRKPMLEKLDVEFMVALENGDMELSKTIGQKKKLLRDVTNQELPAREFGETVSDFSDKIMRIRPEILDWSLSKIPLPKPVVTEIQQ